MRYRFPTIIAISTLFLAVASTEAAEPAVVPLTTEMIGEAPAGASRGFSLKEIKFDENASINDARERSGAVFMSYKRGSKWLGEIPEFIVPQLEVGGEELLDCTDVFEDGKFILAHYGWDHYQTKAVSVVDANRSEVVLLTAFAYEDISRVHYDSENGVVYFTTLAGHYDGSEKARRIAYSIEEEKVLWRSDPGTAHGDFIVYEDHILTHYGFTGVDDFICVIDRRSGHTLKKHQIATAASHLIKGEGGVITVPCYSGVMTFTFEEQ